MPYQLKRLALLGVTAGLLALTAGCGGGGASKADLCNEAAAAFTAFSSGVDAAGTDDAAWNAQTQQLSNKLSEIGNRAGDAELKAVLLEMSETWGNFKIDTRDPASLSESAKLISEQPTKLGTACA
jgi:hypothetical protein